MKRRKVKKEGKRITDRIHDCAAVADLWETASLEKSYRCRVRAVFIGAEDIPYLCLCV
jgi:hypothetical protein